MNEAKAFAMTYPADRLTIAYYAVRAKTGGPADRRKLLTLFAASIVRKHPFVFVAGAAACGVIAGLGIGTLLALNKINKRSL